jgi:hypothetical protein
VSNEQALLLGLVGVAGIGLLAIWLMAEGRHQDRLRFGFRIHFPLDVREDAVIAALRAMAGLPSGRQVLIRSLVFEVVSRDEHIEHRLYVPRSWAQTVRGQLVSAIPGLRLEPLQESADPRPRRVLELGLTSNWRPLRTDTTDAAVRSLLAALGPLRRGEAAVMQWVAQPAGAGPAPSTGRNWPAPPGPWWFRFLLAFWQAPKPDPMSLQAQRAKIGEPLFWVVGRLGAQAAHPARAGQILRQLHSALAAVEAPGARFLS